MEFTWIISLIVLYITISIVNGAIRSTTTNTNVVKRVGEDFEATCRFEFDYQGDFNLLLHVPKWQKIQGSQTEGGATESLLALSTLVESPFKNTGRYNVMAGPPNPRTYFETQLLIKDLKLEDSGLYKCEIHSRDGVLVGQQHKLSVNNSNYETAMHLVGAMRYIEDDPGYNFTELAQHENTTIEYYSTMDGYVDCRYKGSISDVNLNMYIGDKEVTDNLLSSENTVWKGDIKGLKIPYTEKRRFSYKFRLGPNDSHKEMKCLADVNGKRFQEKKRNIEVDAIKVTSPDSDVVKKPFESVDMICHFEFDSVQSFNFIEYTPQWVKLQTVNNNTVAPVVAVTGVTQPMFKTTRRYSTMARPANPQTSFEMKLVLNNIRAEDTGLYKCEMLTNDGVIVSRQHRVTVHSEVTSLTLVGAEEFDENNPMYKFTELSKNKRSVIIYDSTLDGYVDCRSTEGNPEPVLKLYIGDSPITDHVLQSKSVQWKGDTEGLKTPYYENRIYSYNLNLHARDNDKEIRCVAEVNGKKSVEKKRKIKVKSKPVFDEVGCTQTVHAAIGQDVVEVKCQFYSSPKPQKIEWKALTTQDTFTMTGGPYEGYQVVDKIAGSTIISTLKILHVEESDFQSYTLTVKNDQGTNSRTITFIQVPGEPAQGTPSTSAPKTYQSRTTSGSCGQNLATVPVPIITGLISLVIMFTT